MNARSQARSQASPLDLGSEVIIEMGSHSTCWYGTLAALKAEGMLPADFVPPNGRREVRLADEGWQFRIRRCRRPGETARIDNWNNLDSWCLVRWAPDQHRLSGEDIQLREARLAYEEALFRASPAGQDMRVRCMKAKFDRSFQDVVSRLVGESSPT